MSDNQTIRWGILGTGNIAGQFARGLAVLPDARLVAVGSRAAETAAAFAEEFDVPRRHASYEALAADPEVDVVYVATPHPLHHADTLLCLQHGKPVLCEKPLAINARQASEMIEVARRQGLFLMEAVWNRFFPLMDRLRELLDGGAIGRPRLLTADFGFRAEPDPQSRLFDRELAGGALLDVGIYPVSLASLLFGSPDQIATTAHLGPTGVDELSGVVLGYDDGRMALLTSSITLETPMEATIVGESGTICIHRRWWVPEALTLTVGDAQRTIRAPYAGNGYNYEAAAVMACLRSGLRESPIMPLDESLAVLRTLDAIRERWGLRYPDDEPAARARGA